MCFPSLSTGEVTSKKEHKQTTSKHTSNTGTGTRNPAKESCSSKQEQYHSVEDVAYPDHASVSSAATIFICSG